jgi:hypothetical protein
MSWLLRGFAFSFVLAGASVACGGSSSETPLPLPPTRLNAPYRTESAVESAKPPAPEIDDERDLEPLPSQPARSTWGSDAPPPLPEQRLR